MKRSSSVHRIGILLVGISGCAIGPVAVAGRNNSVSVGQLFACLRRTDGTVACRGSNSRGQLGLGAADYDTHATTTVPGLVNVETLWASREHVCAVLRDGTARCWGSMQYGNSLTEGVIASPTTVPGLSSVQQLALGGDHACAVIAGGVVQCWGSNSYGQLGQGTHDDLPHNEVLTVPGLSEVEEIAGGPLYTCARRKDRSVQCWGAIPVVPSIQQSPQVLTGFDDVKQLAGGGAHICALRSDGTVLCLGSNRMGQLGDGTTTDRGTPAPVPGLSGVRALSLGYSNSCAWMDDGSVRCWGDDTWNALGQSTSERCQRNAEDQIYFCQRTPTSVPDVSGVTGLWAGGFSGCVQTGGADVRCWGSILTGQTTQPPPGVEPFLP